MADNHAPDPGLLTTLGQIVDLFGGSARMAEALGAKQTTIIEARRMGSLSVRHWPALIAEAQRRAAEAEAAHDQITAALWREVTSDRLMAINVAADEERRRQRKGEAA